MFLDREKIKWKMLYLRKEKEKFIGYKKIRD